MSDEPLLALLRALDARDYAFVPPTPATHTRVLARPDRKQAHDLAGVFGWSLPFAADLLDSELAGIAQRAGVLEHDGGLLRSRLRVARLHGRLFLHSAFPTDGVDAVFLGPDSYRFADLIAAELGDLSRPARGSSISATGAGVGGIVAAARFARGARCRHDRHQPARAPRSPAPMRRPQPAFEAEFDGERTGWRASRPGIDVALANPPYIDRRGGPRLPGRRRHAWRWALPRDGDAPLPSGWRRADG